MILIVTNSRDATADLVEAELARRSIPLFRLNTDEFPQRVKGHASFSTDGYFLEIRHNSRNEVVRNSDVTAVWYRRPVAPVPADVIEDDAVRRFTTDESYEFLRGFLLCLDSHWVSHPEAIRVAERKLVQLREATKLGLRIPRTAATNDPDAVLDLWHSCPSGLVVKPLYVGFVDIPDKPLSIYTTRINKADLENLGSASLAPSIYQEAIERAEDIRVTVVGNRLFAASIRGPDLPAGLSDWRCLPLSRLEHSDHKLPANIERACIALVRSLDLRFGAIDFVRNAKGEYYFLEINANGQWAWLEKLLGTPITEALIDELTQIS